MGASYFRYLEFDTEVESKDYVFAEETFKPALVLLDSSAAITMYESDKQSQKTRHIERRYLSETNTG